MPQYFDSDGNFKIDKFESELKENNISEARDGYRLNFVGKDYARLQTGQASETVIIPDNDHNNLLENVNSENVFITGDNLEALRHLQNAYTGKIKMIYIDPPYNTGKEFVYNDRFEFNDEKLKTALGYGDAEIERLKSIQGKSSHSAWLTFMYPRLKLAQKLLSPDGVIFVSIDDNEQGNLKLLLDDIFGEANFVGEIIAKTNPGGRDYGGLAVTHDYILGYSKIVGTELNLVEEKGKEFDHNDEIGGFSLMELRNRNIKFNKENRPNLYYPFYINPKKIDKNGLFEISLEMKKDWIELYPQISQGINTVWRWGKPKSLENLNKEIKGKKKQDGGFQIVQKYRSILKRERTIWDETDVRNEAGSLALKVLFPDRKPFDYPKSLSLIQRIIKLASFEDSLIMDFFAGSSTTAQAVMQLNSEDGGSRKFIMVQWAEPTSADSEAKKAGYDTIDEISRERIKRAALHIKSKLEEVKSKKKGELFNENEQQLPLDLGFKHFRLIEPDVKAIDKIFEFNPSENKLFKEDMVTPFAYPNTNTTGLQTILQTWLIQDGYEFDTKIEKLMFSKYESHYVSQSAVLYIINSGFNQDALKELLNKIGKNQLIVTTIIVYPYSFSFEQMRELKSNLKNNLDQNITIIERY